MTKSELVERLSERFSQLTIKDTEVSVQELMEAISGALAKKRRVEIRGFGSFSCNYCPPRVGRNPKSGESVQVPAKWTPHFKPGKELRLRVNAINDKS